MDVLFTTFPYLSALAGESLAPNALRLYLLAVAVVIILFIILLGVIMAKRKPQAWPLAA